MSKGRLAIVGIGEVPTGIYPERSQWDILYEICIQAVRDAGVHKNDIEGVITVAPQAQPRLAAEISFGKIPEELGLKGCRDVCICNAGGASTSNCLRLAEQWIHSGLAKIVLIPHVTVHSTIPVPEVISFFATAGMDLQWEYPYGTTYNGVMGLMAQRYMYETGTTSEQMASVVVALRKWAALDPNSMFYRKPVTLEDVMTSRMISTPLRKRECNVLGDGGAALVVTSAEMAKEITDTPAYKLGEGAAYFSACPILRDEKAVERGWHDSSHKALNEAGVTLEDVDLWNLYIAYPFAIPMMLEAIGICERGKAGQFIMDGHTSPGGKCPVSSIGDAVGRGHTGSGVSMATYAETARQLMGKAGERQVPGAKYVFQNTAGGSGMNNIATVWGRELS
jgi:acetyl-CoA C-acetyltransferase